MAVHGVETKEFPWPKKPWMSKSKIKIMLICFLNIRAIIHFESVSEGTTANQTFYMEASKRLIDAVRHRRGELQRDRSFIVYDNVLAHSSL
jgi:hypothetical protein